jgi:hypothetical protein
MSAAYEYEPTCRHERTELRKRIYVDGRLNVGAQCLRCGSWSAKKRPAGSLDSLPDYDPGLYERFLVLQREVWQRQEEERKRLQEQERKDWWARYNRYLVTDRWRRKRASVLARANNTCEALIRCSGARATQVHHLTYQRVGDEPIFDLRAVCHECHERLTQMSRSNVSPLDELFPRGGR